MPASHDEFCGPASYQLHGGELQKQSPVANILSLVCTDKVLGKPLNYLVRLAFIKGQRGVCEGQFCSCFVCLLMSPRAGEEREQTLEMIFIESVMHLAHTLGSHTLLQTAAVAQMWREEAITRDGINRSGRRAARLSPVQPGGCGSSKNRFGAAAHVGRERNRRIEDRNGDQRDTSSGFRGQKSVCGQWRAAKGLKRSTLDLMMRPHLSVPHSPRCSHTPPPRANAIIAFSRSFFHSHHGPLSVSSHLISLPSFVPKHRWRDLKGRA